eukprot:363701-Chlamydomonas_euryale.AAC.4
MNGLGMSLWWWRLELSSSPPLSYTQTVARVHFWRCSPPFDEGASGHQNGPPGSPCLHPWCCQASCRRSLRSYLQPRTGVSPCAVQPKTKVEAKKAAIAIFLYAASAAQFLSKALLAAARCCQTALGWACLYEAQRRRKVQGPATPSLCWSHRHTLVGSAPCNSESVYAAGRRE